MSESRRDRGVVGVAWADTEHWLGQHGERCARSQSRSDDLASDSPTLTFRFSGSLPSETLTASLVILEWAV